MTRNGDLPDSHCVVFAHVLNTGGGGGSMARKMGGGAKLSAAFAKIPQLEVNLEEEGNRYIVYSLALKKELTADQVFSNGAGSDPSLHCFKCITGPTSDQERNRLYLVRSTYSI